MKNYFKKMSLSSKNLRYKLVISFALMSVIPILVSVHLFWNYILREEGVFNFDRGALNAGLLIFISFVLAFLGFYFLGRRIIASILSLSHDARIIADGDFSKRIKIEEGDEIADLGISLNQMSAKIQKDIVEINKKMLVLSGVLQTSSLISGSYRLGEVLDVIAGELSHLGSIDKGFVMVFNPESGLLEPASGFGLKMEGIKPLRGKETDFFGESGGNNGLLVDAQNKAPNQDTEDFLKGYGIKNAFICPVRFYGLAMGLVVTGNGRAGFTFDKNDLEILEIFVKQIVIAIEDNLLRNKVKELEMKDGLTGLYNERYIRERLDEEIRRAVLYQRPCSFALLNIGGFKEYAREYGKSRGEEVLKKAAAILKDNAEEVDKVGRFEEELFAVILFEKNKGEANRIMQHLKESIKERLGIEGLTLNYGLSANPVDGENAGELIAEAKKVLENG